MNNIRIISVVNKGRIGDVFISALFWVIWAGLFFSVVDLLDYSGLYLSFKNYYVFKDLALFYIGVAVFISISTIMWSVYNLYRFKTVLNLKEDGYDKIEKTLVLFNLSRKEMEIMQKSKQIEADISEKGLVLNLL